MYLIVQLLFIELKKATVSEIFAKLNYFFSAAAPATNKLDDGIIVTQFQVLKT